MNWFSWLLETARQASTKQPPPSAVDPISVGLAAVAEATKLWNLNIRDLPPVGHPDREHCRQLIDNMIRSEFGLGWNWERPYSGSFEWCGAFVSFCYGATLPLATRRNYFSSTYRLDRWARYQQVNEHDKNVRPNVGPFRMVVDLDGGSTAADAVFPDGSLPRAGDILLVGPERSAYGKHVTMVERFDAEKGVFFTLEGNGTGDGPSGSMHGVVRGQRRVGLAAKAPTTYHARRLIRMAPIDLK